MAGSAHGKRVLLVEDDGTLRKVLGDALTGEGYAVTAAADGDAAHELLFERHFDVVVLDVMLPGRGGLELLRAFRGAGQGAPVLLLTARGDEHDVVLGFELGADDYVTKPFGLRELLARVGALARRGGGAGAGPVRFTVGAATVDLEAFEVDAGGQRHALSPKEAAMLALLYEHRGRVVRRAQFLDAVWGSEQFVGPRTVDTHVLNLRAKLEPEPKQPRFLRTVHGAGYRLDPDGEAGGAD